MHKNKIKNLVSLRHDPYLYFRLGVKYADKRMFDTAIKYLKKSIELDPTNSEYLYDLACLHAEMKNPELSNEILLKIVKYYDPAMTECYFGIGCNYYDLGRFKKAREYFEKYVVYEPEGEFTEETHEILYYLEYYHNMDFDDSRDIYVKRLFNTVRKYVKTGEYTKALAKLDRIIEFDPVSIKARNEISLIYFLSDNMAMAETLAKSAIRLDSENIVSLCILALIYDKKGSQQLYKSGIEYAISLNILSEDMFYNLIDAFLIFEQHIEIFEALKQVLSKFTDNFRKSIPGSDVIYITGINKSLLRKIEMIRDEEVKKLLYDVLDFQKKYKNRNKFRVIGEK